MLGLFVTAKPSGTVESSSENEKLDATRPELGSDSVWRGRGAAEVSRELGFRHEAAHAVEKGAGVGHADP